MSLRFVSWLSCVNTLLNKVLFSRCSRGQREFKKQKSNSFLFYFFKKTEFSFWDVGCWSSRTKNTIVIFWSYFTNFWAQNIDTVKRRCSTQGVQNKVLTPSDSRCSKNKSQINKIWKFSIFWKRLWPPKQLRCRKQGVVEKYYSYILVLLY
jgi:hypothetical protein